MKTIWLEIDTDEMMAIDLVTFIEFLSVYKMEYSSYYGMESGIFMKVTGDMTDDFNKKLSQFIYYKPIVQLDIEPLYSDIDLIEEMSNT